MDLLENDTRGESPSTQRRPIMERHLSTMVDSFLERARFSYYDGVFLFHHNGKKIYDRLCDRDFFIGHRNFALVTTATIGHLSKIPVTLKSMKSP